MAGFKRFGPRNKIRRKIILARCDEPVNKLHEVAREHDIFYRDHKNVKVRNIADKILENKAWKGAMDLNASLNEKIPALVTTNVIKVK